MCVPHHYVLQTMYEWMNWIESSSQWRRTTFIWRISLWMTVAKGDIWINDEFFHWFSVRLDCLLTFENPNAKAMLIDRQRVVALQAVPSSDFLQTIHSNQVSLRFLPKRLTAIQRLVETRGNGVAWLFEWMFERRRQCSIRDKYGYRWENSF